MKKIVTVVDASKSNEKTKEFFEKNHVAEKIKKITLDIILLDKSKRDWAGIENRVSSFAEMLAKTSDAEMIVHILPEQVFIDADIVKGGLETLKETPDFFTQWEHVRLPLGIGARAVSVKKIASDNVSSFEEYYANIRKQPEGYNCKYDSKVYCSFEDAGNSALLDDRLLKVLGDSPVDGLKSFSDIAKKTDLKIIPIEADKTDERGIPAAYGFETPECAVFPTYVMFDMTNRCNARCIHCPQSVGFKGQSEPIFIKSELYKKIIDEVAKYNVDFIRITADGEPLLHPEIYNLLHYTGAEKGLPVGLTTNGSILNEVNVEKLLDAEIMMMDVSLDAFSQETYEHVRAGLSYEKTMANMENLLKRRKERNHKMKVMVSFVKQKENLHEVDKFKEYWEGKVDQVLIREMISNVGINDIEGSSEDYAEVRWPCPHWFRRVVVNYDGELKACPIDWQGGTKYGSLADTTVYDVWHSDFYHKNRMEHLNQEFSEDIMCKPCRDWQGTPWKWGYEKLMKKL